MKFRTLYYYENNWDRFSYIGLDTDVISVPNVGDMLYLNPQFRKGYYCVEERIFDSIKNIVHLRLKKMGKETESIVLRGHQW